MSSTITSHEKANTRTPAKAALRYQSGFGNEFASEAVEGVLPRGQNSPQKVAHGLYTEQLSGTRVHRAARRQPAHLALSDASLGGAQALPADQPEMAAQRAV